MIDEKNIFMRMINPNGDVSFIRMMGIPVIVAGIVFVFLNPELWYGGVAMIGTGLAGKVSQKIFERKA